MQILGLIYPLGQMIENTKVLDEKDNDLHDHGRLIPARDGWNHIDQHGNRQYILHMLQSNQVRLPNEAWDLFAASGKYDSNGM
jgi:hypothetical protein